MAICLYCNGTGQYLEKACPQCLGSGVAKGVHEALTSQIITMEAKVATLESLYLNLQPTYKVASCINSTEYLALSDAAKDGVKIVLSCGFVDMRVDQWARTTLWAIFGAQSTTRANLVAMFG